jgi:hypothetical protein
MDRLVEAAPARRSFMVSHGCVHCAGNPEFAAFPPLQREPRLFPPGHDRQFGFASRMTGGHRFLKIFCRSSRSFRRTGRGEPEAGYFSKPAARDLVERLPPPAEFCVFGGHGKLRSIRGPRPSPAGKTRRRGQRRDRDPATRRRESDRDRPEPFGSKGRHRGSNPGTGACRQRVNRRAVLNRFIIFAKSLDSLPRWVISSAVIQTSITSAQTRDGCLIHRRSACWCVDERA